MNKVLLRSDKGEYLPGETICGAVYLDIKNPTEAHGVRLSFNGREEVSCESDVKGSKTPLRASHDYINFCNVDLFDQQDPFALGSYCFPFRLQLPYVIAGSFQASSGATGKVWSASVTYTLHTSIVGAHLMEAEQEVVVTAVVSEALRDNHQTQAHDITLPTNSLFGFGRKVHITVKPLVNYVRSGDCARLRLVLTNPLKSRSASFGIKLIRTMTLTIPYKTRTSAEGHGDLTDNTSASAAVDRQCVWVDGGRSVVREMSGDISQHSSISLASGGGLDNIMIPLRTTDGINVMPTVHGKYVKCEYSLEVSLHQGDSNVQTVSVPVTGVLPEENAQWLSWNPTPWMNTAHVKLSKDPGPFTPPEQLLGSEAFGRLPRFQDL